MGRTLSATLLAAQKDADLLISKIVLTKTAQTTRTYTDQDEANQLLNVSHDENTGKHTAEVIIDNSDGALSALDLRGYQAAISNGFNTTAGDEYSAKPPLFVISQRFDAYQD